MVYAAAGEEEARSPPALAVQAKTPQSPLSTHEQLVASLRFGFSLFLFSAVLLLLFCAILPSEVLSASCCPPSTSRVLHCKRLLSLLVAPMTSRYLFLRLFTQHTSISGARRGRTSRTPGTTPIAHLYVFSRGECYKRPRSVASTASSCRLYRLYHRLPLPWFVYASSPALCCDIARTVLASMGQAKPSTAAHGVSASSASSFMVVLLSVLTFLREEQEV